MALGSSQFHTMSKSRVFCFDICDTLSTLFVQNKEHTVICHQEFTANHEAILHKQRDV